MSFSTILYHEIREKSFFDPNHPSEIDVKQNYVDILPSPLFVTLENFEDQMNYLYEHHFHTLTLDEIKDYYYQKKEIPKSSVLLTFDDCFQSLKYYAYPILKKYNFHAVAFVVSNWINEHSKQFMPEKSVCLTEADLMEMTDVFEYANHTDSFHTRLDAETSRMMVESDDEFAKDLLANNQKSYINGKDIFAYPFGLYEDRNVSLLRKEGFQLAFTCIEGSNDKTTDPLLLKRNVIPYFMEMSVFQSIVNQK